MTVSFSLSVLMCPGLWDGKKSLWFPGVTPSLSSHISGSTAGLTYTGGGGGHGRSLSTPAVALQCISVYYRVLWLCATPLCLCHIDPRVEPKNTP